RQRGENRTPPEQGGQKNGCAPWQVPVSSYPPQRLLRNCRNSAALNRGRSLRPAPVRSSAVSGGGHQETVPCSCTTSACPGGLISAHRESAPYQPFPARNLRKAMTVIRYLRPRRTYCSRLVPVFDTPLRRGCMMYGSSTTEKRLSS